jgi:hypothetical protein
MEEKDFKTLTNTTMIKDIIEMAVNRRSDITISYSKDGETTSIVQLTDVSYSEKYGKDYITGLSGEKELTFKIDRIVNVEIGWVDVNNRNVCSTNDGLYLITFNYAWHLDYELKICIKGEKILDNHLENDKGIGNSDYSPQSSLAYHHIPFFNSEESDKWVSINEEMDVPQEKGIIIVAYKLDNADIKDRERKWIRTMWRCSNDIYYSFFIIKDDHSFSYPDALKNPHIEILAYYLCSEYVSRHDN